MEQYSTEFEEFYKTGIAVIPNVFSDEEVENIRNRFHCQLALNGIDHYKILSGEEIMLDAPRIKGRCADMYYSKWKIDAQLDQRVYDIWKYLMGQTYGIKRDGFDHPFENFDDVIPFLDRVCYRLPDSIRAEGGLEMHLDRNIHDPYLLKSGGLKKWRPIQGFIALTDQYGSENGGLKVVKGFHKYIDEYFSKSNEKCEEGGEFYRFMSKSHTALEKKLEPISVPKGSLVFFDNKLPHATCSRLSGNDTREVIYCSYLPTTLINMNYCKEQLQNIRLNIAPPNYVKEGMLPGQYGKDWTEDELNNLEKKLLGIYTHSKSHLENM